MPASFRDFGGGALRSVAKVPQEIHALWKAVEALEPRLTALEPRLVALERDVARQPALSPTDQFVSMSYAVRSDGVFHGSYELWRIKRISKLLAIYGSETLSQMKILEVGAAHADIGAFLADLGAEVVAVDGRRENLEFARLKHRNVTGLSYEIADLDQDFSRLGKFDLLIHFGLLYHIADIDTHLARCFASADDVVLETVVSDSSDPYHTVVIEEDSTVNEEALSGQGSRPSAAYVERLATEHGFGVTRYFDADLNAHFYVYDWEPRNDGDLGGWGRRRFWRFSKQPDSAT